jgi:hypothetical protein
MHDVKALVAQERWLREETASLRNAVICPLVQGFALVPITDSLGAELNTEPPKLEIPLIEMAPGVIEVAQRTSQGTAVAYISTEYFGGDGCQEAIAWLNGEVIFSPESKGYMGDWPNSAISQALRTIGVIANTGQDEFDTLGLGSHRETHRWAEAFASK